MTALQQLQWQFEAFMIQVLDLKDAIDKLVAKEKEQEALIEGIARDIKSSLTHVRQLSDEELKKKIADGLKITLAKGGEH